MNSAAILLYFFTSHDNRGSFSMDKLKIPVIEDDKLTRQGDLL
jgi:hypothetical protein